MGRRKKKKGDFNFILGLAALVVFGWIGIDLYFNYQKRSQKESVPPAIVAEPEQKQESVQVAEAPAVELESGFKLETWRDDRYGFEFQYPITAAVDARCPKLEKTENGFAVGAFSLIAAGKQGTLADYIDRQLEGMEVETRENLTVAGQAAVKVNYQTPGMGWYGSSVFLEGKTKFFEFGLLANEAGDKCGGIDDYEDRVYQSMISTLKFAD